MKFSELIEKVRQRGVAVAEIRSQSDPEIRGIAEDSRKVRPGDLFIARPGTKTTGTQFIDDAFARGAVGVVLQEDVGLPCAVAWARVSNINLACAVLAHELAGNPTAGMKVVGITGTKGKTTVAYLLRSVLKAVGHKVGMIGTVEIDDGEKVVPADMTTPGSVELVELFKKMRANGVTHCVMEVSSHALHQHRVAGIDFAVAIFTNLTGDHLDYHKTMEEYAAAKAMLFEGLKEGAVAVVNSDDKYTTFIAARSKTRISYFGFLTDGYRAVISQMKTDSMRLGVTREGQFPFTVDTPLIGKHNAYNLLAVIAAADALGLPRDVVLENLSKNVGAPGRLQPVTLSGTSREEMPFQVFVDYAHTHDALSNVLNALRNTMKSTYAPDGMVATGRLICLFGCGGDRDRTKRAKMGRVSCVQADLTIITSDNPRTENPDEIIKDICIGIPSGMEDFVIVEPDRRAAIRLAIAAARPGDVLLLAGKGHENYQIIGTTKHHFDDVEEAQNALQEIVLKHQDTKTRS